MRQSLTPAVIVVVLLALVAVPFVPQVVYPVFVMKVMCFAIFACAFNLLLGHTGILSFGHAAYFGGAAYIAGYAMREMLLPPEIGLLAAMAFAGLLGAAFGALAIRRSGIYLAMITLALAQLTYFIFLRAPFTGAEDGMQQIPRGVLFGLIDLRSDFNLYFVVLALTILAMFAIYRIVNSPFGEVLKAIREHEPRARSLGYPVDRYKITVFALSGALSGLAGGMKALIFRLAALTDVHWHTSGDVILMTLLGGMSSVFGPAIGAVLISSLHQYLDRFGAWVTVIIGLVFIACVLVFRRGVVGQVRHVLALREAGRPRPVGRETTGVKKNASI